MTDRRVFDDLFAKALNDVGVQGLPGYQFIEKATASEDAFDAGVAKSGGSQSRTTFNGDEARGTLRHDSVAMATWMVQDST